MKKPTMYATKLTWRVVVPVMLLMMTLASCATGSDTISGGATANAICDEWNESLLAWEQTATTEQLEDLFIESEAWQDVCGH